MNPSLETSICCECNPKKTEREREGEKGREEGRKRKKEGRKEGERKKEREREGGRKEGRERKKVLGKKKEAAEILFLDSPQKEAKPRQINLGWLNAKGVCQEKQNAVILAGRIRCAAGPGMRCFISPLAPEAKAWQLQNHQKDSSLSETSRPCEVLASRVPPPLSSLLLSLL